MPNTILILTGQSRFSSQDVADADIVVDLVGGAPKIVKDRYGDTKLVVR